MTDRLIKNFIAEFGPVHAGVRDTRARAKFGNSVTEIRSNRHAFIAYKVDELGNVLVMDAKGNRKQLIGEETKVVLR